MMAMTRNFRLTLGGAAVAALIGAAPQLAAQQPTASSYLVVLDQNSLDHGPPPHLLPPELVNDAIAAPGVREELPWFAAREGQHVTIQGGAVDNPGWFAFRANPVAWDTEPGANDGLENFVLAGPGVGSPDVVGDRESLLRGVAEAVPLQAAGLALLVGRQVCGVVYDREVTYGPGNPTNLAGPTLGILAFQVVRLIEPASSTALPNVEIQIVESHEVCHGSLSPLAEAPDPGNQH